MSALSCQVGCNVQLWSLRWVLVSRSVVLDLVLASTRLKAILGGFGLALESTGIGLGHAKMVLP